MVEANRVAPTNDPQDISSIVKNEVAMKLLAEMLAGRIVDIKPQFDFTSEQGFVYPLTERTLNVKGKELVSLLEFLASKDMLKKSFFDKLLRCPQCQSVNLRPSNHCPKCGSGNVVRGRVLEHSVCKYVGLEEEFATKGRYICPKCKAELRAVGTDYQSLGLMRKCYECGEVFNIPLVWWHCLKCSALTSEDKINEINVYSYSLDETKRSWLEFEIKPKAQLIEFLKQQGYEVAENARVKGRSGADHNIDILATRDDGVISYTVAIGIEVAGDRIGLEKIFDFDDKAYDVGIHDKMLIVIPSLIGAAEQFASQQRIKVLEVKDLETVLASGAPVVSWDVVKEPFEFESKSQLITHLERRGYEVKENAVVRGRSGADHNIDILATRDEGILTHRIAIGVGQSEETLGLDKILDFDGKTYDIGIQDKVFIAVPGVNAEARNFAERQRIKVYEALQLEPAS